jgi:hypothetical protein
MPDGSFIVMEIHRIDDGTNQVRCYDCPEGTTDDQIQAKVDAYAAQINLGP